MRSLRRTGVVVAVTSVLAMGSLSLAGVASGQAPAASTGASSSSTGPVPGTCNIVPASVFASDLGMAMFERGPGNVVQQLSVNGQTESINWSECEIQHVVGDSAGMGFVLSFVFEPTSAEASSILQAACASMRTIATPGSWSTPAIGNGACTQGHGPPMQNASGYLVVDDVVVGVFGSQSPAQTVTVLKSVAPYLSVSNLDKAIGTSGASTAPGATSVVARGVTYTPASKRIAVTLSCGKARCSGVAELRVGATILAKGRFLLPKGKTSAIDLPLTARGTTILANAAITPVRATVHVTVSGGKATNKPVVIR